MRYSKTIDGGYLIPAGFGAGGEQALARCANTLTGADIPDPAAAEENPITVRIKED